MASRRSDQLARYYPVAVLGLMVLAGLHAGPAWAIGVSAFGIVQMTAPNASPQPLAEYSSGSAFGGGGLLGLRFLHVFELEAGAIYAPREYRQSGDVNGVSVDYRTRETFALFPAALRLSIVRPLSIGAGCYYALATGKLRRSGTSNGQSFEETLEYADLGIAQRETGVFGSVAFRPTLFGPVGMVLDARYMASFGDRDEYETRSLKFREFLLLGGLTFGL